MVESVVMSDLEEYKKTYNIDEMVRRRNGLGTAALRQRVWPKLLGLNKFEYADSNYTQFIATVNPNQVFVNKSGSSITSYVSSDNKARFSTDDLLSSHRDYKTIQNDIARSLWSESSIGKATEFTRWQNDVFMHRSRLILTNTILLILNKHPQLFYYQGYHDILTVIHLVLRDPFLTYAASEAVTLRFLTDMMQSEFTAVTITLPLILSIIREADVELHDVLLAVLCVPSGISEENSENSFPTEEQYSQATMFTLCNFITWFAHDIKNMTEICWIYDLFLAMPPDYSLYFAAALIISFKDDIMELAYSTGEGEDHLVDSDGVTGEGNHHPRCDYATMYTFLLNLSRPGRDPDISRPPLNIYHIIEITDTLYSDIYPPNVLLSYVLHSNSPTHKTCAEMITTGRITIFDYLYRKKSPVYSDCFNTDEVLLLRAIRVHGGLIGAPCRYVKLEQSCANMEDMMQEKSKTASTWRWTDYVPVVVGAITHGLVIYLFLFTDPPTRNEML